ncbi:ABC transporter permease subunit [Natrialbaceae archaeon A-CW3]
MSWRLVGKKEIGDAIRNYQLYANALIFVAVFGGFGYLFVRDVRRSARVDPSMAPDPIEFVGLLSFFCIIMIPAVGLMVSYDAIVKRRTGGQLALLLGMPHDRRDVVVGTLLGRFAVFAAALLAGLGAALLVLLVFGVSPPFGALIGFAVATAGLGLAYVAIGIGLSGWIRSPTWAAIAAFGVFMLFVFVWRAVPDGVVYLASGFEIPSETPWWRPYVTTLSPSVAYERVLDAYVFDDAQEGYPTAFGAVVLLGWTVLAPLVGYLRFDRTDL